MENPPESPRSLRQGSAAMIEKMSRGNKPNRLGSTIAKQDLRKATISASAKNILESLNQVPGSQKETRKGPLRKPLGPPPARKEHPEEEKCHVDKIVKRSEDLEVGKKGDGHIADSLTERKGDMPKKREEGYIYKKLGRQINTPLCWRLFKIRVQHTSCSGVGKYGARKPLTAYRSVGKHRKYPRIAVPQVVWGLVYTHFAKKPNISNVKQIENALERFSKDGSGCKVNGKETPVRNRRFSFQFGAPGCENKPSSKAVHEMKMLRISFSPARPTILLKTAMLRLEGTSGERPSFAPNHSAPSKAKLQLEKQGTIFAK